MNPPKVNQTQNLDEILGSPEGLEAVRIIDRLRESGYTALLAGGCVRDGLLGKTPKDFDVATNATPDVIREVFGHRSTLAFGASFGVIGVQAPRNSSEANEIGKPTNSPLKGHVTEVATFRSDGEYTDGRRPNSVTFGDAKADAMRRDFTINGLFYDPAESAVIDYVGGQEDLKAGRLRTIGRAADRFDEDKLRMLRAVRFATSLQFAVDPDTRDAIQQHADQMQQVSSERIGAEVRKILASVHATDGLRLIVETGLNHVIWPALTSTQVDQSTALIAARSSYTFVPSLVLALVVHPQPVETLRDLRKRWCLSNEEYDEAAFALANWRTFAKADHLPWSQVQPKVVHREGEATMMLAESIARAAQDDDHAKTIWGDIPEAGIAKVRAARLLPEQELDPTPLVNGDLLKRLGIPPGPEYRTLIQSVRDQQLDGEITTPAEALEWIRKARQET